MGYFCPLYKVCLAISKEQQGACSGGEIEEKAWNGKRAGRILKEMESAQIAKKSTNFADYLSSRWVC